MRLPAILLLLLLFSTIVAAQTPQIIPTARLLTMPSDVSTVTRPRRVSVPASTPVSAAVDPNDIERHAFDNTNEVRIRSGLAPLVWDVALLQAARIHSEDMVRHGYFAHETPEGAGLRARVRVVGILHFKVLAENIAYNQGFDDPGAFAVERWMLSPGHRANILSSEFDQSAVGTFVAPDGTVYLTQVFLKR